MIQQARMTHAYCVGSNSGRKNMRFQLALHKTFCPSPQPLSQQQVKQRQRTKINRTVLSPPSIPPHQYSTQSLQHQNWRANKSSILAVNELGPPVLESSADPKILCSHWFWTQISQNGNRNLATHRIQCGIVLIGNTQS